VRSGRTWRTAAGAAVGLVALLVPALALADGSLGSIGGFTYFASSATMFPHAGISSTAAVCPPGSGHVVGGGFDADTGSVGGLALESTPVDSPDDADHKPDDGWRAAAFDTRTVNADLAAFVVCANTKVSYKSSTKKVKGGKRAKLTAHCPAGTKDTAGGVQTGDFDAVQISSSYPVDDGDANKKPDDGWAAQVFNRGGRATVTVWAVCAKGAEVTYIDSTVFPLEAGTPSEVALSVVDDPLHITGGGASFPNRLSTPETRLTATAPTDAGFDVPEDTVPDDRMTLDVANDNPLSGGKIRRFEVALHE
jgi:hypothetical protein